jgi:DNA-binding NtrC family response regulator
VAASAAPVLLLGETGAGKEVLARAVHEKSSVSSGPLVELNCSAVPENLLESELFGHEKGAFTDAKARKEGVFELAHGGTLFLDEIGDMQVNLQAKLLRVLENGTFKRVGGTANLEVSVRVIAATNRDLKERVQAGQFREDLYYRLAVFPIDIPPLRERREDILPLARFFLSHVVGEAEAGPPAFAPEAEQALVRYAWPGNVRELRNVMERAFLLCQGGTIGVRHLPREVVGAEDAAEGSGPPGAPPAGDRVWSLADAERFAIERAMLHFEGNKTRAAEALGISRGTLRIKLRQHGLEG